MSAPKAGREETADYFDDFDDLDEPDVCETCWGEGSGEEAELEMDWINYGTDWVMCPDCKGTGYQSRPASAERRGR